MGEDKELLEQEREKIKKRYKGMHLEALEKIPAKPQLSLFDDESDKRVAVYARVSTLSKQQMSSYEIQQNHYSDLVSRQNGWELVKIYADNGISGTSLNHRDAFMEMIEDCRKGGIDLIVVKSVSRFSRSVKDGITIVEELAALRPPVGVWFENERIYTLSNESEFLLNLTQSVAQEESRVKSVAMNSSVEMRFSRGIFLTPPLLGYDNNEDGALVINEVEASIVKLIFYMYLHGRSTGDIAETLTLLGLRSKKGNTNWSAGSVYGVLTNERHCGRVLSRKTFTPNYKNHKSRKNRGDKNQYVAYNHHPPIISEDDFIAAQHMIANAKYGNHSFLPQLNVITDGALHGFVTVNPRWAAFTADDYIAASASAGEAKLETNAMQVKVKQGDIDLRGSSVVDAKYFVDAYVTCVSMDKKHLIFSSACVRKFDGIEYVEILVHPVLKLLAVRPCDEKCKHAIRWSHESDGRAFGRECGCVAFAKTIFELFGWNMSAKHRVRGKLKKYGNETIALFDAADAQIITSQTDMLPLGIANSFGKTFYSHACDAGNIKGKRIGVCTMYNTFPDLNPTPEERLRHSITQLTNEMQGDVGGG